MDYGIGFIEQCYGYQNLIFFTNHYFVKVIIGAASLARLLFCTNQAISVTLAAMKKIRRLCGF